MPYANSGGVRINYEVEGSANGPPLVLQHGLTGYLESWRERGYTDALGDAYRLILIDARGHGRSDKPHEPAAYGSAMRAQDVVAVLDDLGVDQTHYFGYSMGGRIGCAILSHAPERLLSLTIGGFDPYATRSAATIPQTRAEFEDSVDARPGLTPAARERLLANDLEALRASTAGSVGPATAPGALGQPIPMLLFAGEHDAPLEGAKRAAAEATMGRFFSVPGQDHPGAIADVEFVAPRVRAFLDEVSASAAGRTGGSIRQAGS